MTFYLAVDSMSFSSHSYEIRSTSSIIGIQISLTDGDIMLQNGLEIFQDLYDKIELSD